MASRIVQGSVFDVLPTLEPGSVDAVVTSPPYFRLRSYLPKDHALKGLELGSEPTVAAYIENMVRVFELVKRAMSDHATCWLNIGDSYSSGNSGEVYKDNGKGAAGHKRERVPGIPAGNLCLVPQRLAIALQDNGWICRSMIVWHKPAPMPSSVAGWSWRKHRIRVSKHEYERMQQVQDRKADQPVQLEQGEIGRASALLQRVQKTSESFLLENRPLPDGMEEAAPEAQGVGKISGLSIRLPPEAGGQGEIERKEQDSEQEGIKEERPKEILAKSKGKGKKTAKRPNIQADGKRPGDNQKSGGEAAGIQENSLYTDGGAMEGNHKKPQGEMLLLQQKDSEADSGSCYPIIEGRSPYSRECGAGLPSVQSQKGRENGDTVLIDCQGCEKCRDTEGYVLRRGSWRCTSSWEPILMLAKSDKYFCDGEAVKTPAAAATVSRDQYMRVIDDPHEQFAVKHDHETQTTTANLRDVWRGPELESLSKEELIGLIQSMDDGGLPDTWTIAAEPLKEKHYAAYPTELVLRCLKAATSARGYCPACGKPWARLVESKLIPLRGNSTAGPKSEGNHEDVVGLSAGLQQNGHIPGVNETKTIGWRPSCGCPAAEPRPGLVLDPFSGSGRTGLAAAKLGLDYVGVELSPDYAEMSRSILYNDAPLFSEGHD